MRTTFCKFYSLQFSSVGLVFNLYTRKKLPDPVIEPQLYIPESLQAAVTGADLVLLLVDHREFKSITPDSIRPLGKPVIFDTRGSMNAAEWRAAGFQVMVLGA